MTTATRILAPLAALILTTLGLLAGTTANANATEADLAGKWETPSVVIYVPTTLPKWGVPTAIRQWRAATAGVLTIAVTRTPCVDCITITAEANPDPTFGGWSTVWQRDDKTIVRCDLHVTPDRITKRRVERVAIVTHELGHCLGLAHNDVPGSAMAPGATGGPSEYDTANLTALYAQEPTA